MFSLPVVFTPANRLPADPRPSDRFAPPPWDADSPAWQRLDRKIPADHLARRIDRAVARLDLSPLFDSYAGTGSKAHRPDVLLKVVLYELQQGEASPAQWAEDLRWHEIVQWLGRGMTPARSRLYAFRDRLGPLLDVWHQQVLADALEQGLTTGEQASLDGSTIAANASRHRLLNQKQLDSRQQQLDQALAADQQGTTPAARPGWMATTPGGRLAQAQHYQDARTHLQQRLADNQRRPKGKRLPADKVRISASDPEAVLGLDKAKVYRPLYNVQLVPDLGSSLVLAWEVFAQATDAGTLPQLLPRLPTVKDLLTDAAYATALDLAACARAGVTLYAPYQENAFTAQRPAQPAQQIPKSAFTWLAEEQTYRCPQGHQLEVEDHERKRRADGQRLLVTTYRCPGEHCRVCPLRQTCARDPEAGRTVQRHEHEALVEALRERMASPQAKALYRRRGQTVELGFADLKEHRCLRRFSGRGRERVRTQVGLTVLVHNLLTVDSAPARSALGPPLTPEKVAS
jgi:transposase